MGKGLAFTGYRPEVLLFGEYGHTAEYSNLKMQLLCEVLQFVHQGYDRFYCGMARGSDIFFGQVVLLVKTLMYPHIQLICVIPHEGQANKWTVSWRIPYFNLLKMADDTVMISLHYMQDCFYKRNRYMVDHADTVLAVYNQMGRGGTAYTVDYAKRKGKGVIIINPTTKKRVVWCEKAH